MFAIGNGNNISFIEYCTIWSCQLEPIAPNSKSHKSHTITVFLSDLWDMWDVWDFYCGVRLVRCEMCEIFTVVWDFICGVRFVIFVRFFLWCEVCYICEICEILNLMQLAPGCRVVFFLSILHPIHQRSKYVTQAWIDLSDAARNIPQLSFHIYSRILISGSLDKLIRHLTGSKVREPNPFFTF